MTVELAFAATGIGAAASTSSSAATSRPTRSRRPTCCCSRSSASAPRPSEAVYVGDSPFDMTAAKAGGLFAIGVTWGRRPRPAAARARRPRRASPRSSLPRSEARGQGRRAPRAPHALGPRVLRPRRAERRRRGLRPELRRAARARARPPRARAAGLADPASRRPALGGLPEGRSPRADGLAREGHHRRRRSPSGPTTFAVVSIPTSPSPT